MLHHQRISSCWYFAHWLTYLACFQLFLHHILTIQIEQNRWNHASLSYSFSYGYASGIFTLDSHNSILVPVEIDVRSILVPTLVFQLYSWHQSTIHDLLDRNISSNSNWRLRLLSLFICFSIIGEIFFFIRCNSMWY